MNCIPSRGQKKIKVPRPAASRCWPLFMRQGKACAFPSASGHPDCAEHVSWCNSEYSRYSPPQAQLWFLCIMFIAAFACSVFLLARDKNALCFTSKDLLCGLLIGVMNAVSNLFMLKCLDVLSVNSVMLSVPASNMLIAALIGQFFFKEKLNIHTWIALVLTVISLILTNWLRKNDTQTVQKLRRCRQRIGISDICKSG